MFTHRVRIYIHHTDCAGRLFFGSKFFLVHEAKEHFLESLGVSVSEILNHPEVTFPLIHAEADYKAVLVVGDMVDIDVSIEKIGETSVVFLFALKRPDGRIVGSAKTVSVAVNKKTNQKTALPKEWRKKFEKGL
ncbi:MAG: acyl-CoA thioesterase [Candidatus Omnitrophica bacterium]|nr:acyl-CoA thioesterase [Candidatus Omnitrophota bacterium]